MDNAATSLIQQDVPLATRGFVYLLSALLPRIGRPDLVASISIEEVGEGQCTVWLKAEGIGIDVGHEIEVRSIARNLTRPGLRVFTMEVCPGTRHTPPEDVDKTQVEVFHEDEALICVASLLAKVATLSLPPMPDDLCVDHTEEESAWT